MRIELEDKMKILVMGSTFYLNEIKDFFFANDIHPYFAKNTLKAISIMNNHEITFAFIVVNSLNEAILLKYINQNFEKVKVVLLTNTKYKEIITILREGKYYLMQDPFRFDEIQNIIKEKLN